MAKSESKGNIKLLRQSKQDRYKFLKEAQEKREAIKKLNKLEAENKALKYSRSKTGRLTLSLNNFIKAKDRIAKANRRARYGRIMPRRLPRPARPYPTQPSQQYYPQSGDAFTPESYTAEVESAANLFP